MARVTRTYLVDDIDGSEEDVNKVRLGLDGQNFEIDLSAANEARLREKLARFVEAGKRVTDKPNPHRGRKAVKSAPAGRDERQAAREWLRGQGYQVGDRGRIKAELMDLYHSSRS